MLRLLPLCRLNLSNSKKYYFAVVVLRTCLTKIRLIKKVKKNKIIWQVAAQRRIASQVQNSDTNRGSDTFNQVEFNVFNGCLVFLININHLHLPLSISLQNILIDSKIKKNFKIKVLGFLPVVCSKLVSCPAARQLNLLINIH